MDHSLIGKIVLLGLVFLLTATVVARTLPRASPATERRRFGCWLMMVRTGRFTLWHLVVLTAVAALGLAILVKLGTELAVLYLVLSVLLVGNVIYPRLWLILETAGAVTAFTWALIEFSNVSPSFGGGILLLYVVCPVVWVSWLVRTCLQWSTPHSHSDWVALLLIPFLFVVASVLIWTDVPFRVRLAASERALREYARNAPVGLVMRDERVGLFWAERIEEHDGCVAWFTGGFLRVSDGFAYYPKETPPEWQYHRFEHIWGPWWKVWAW